MQRYEGLKEVQWAFDGSMRDRCHPRPPQPTIGRTIRKVINTSIDSFVQFGLDSQFAMSWLRLSLAAFNRAAESPPPLALQPFNANNSAKMSLRYANCGT